MRGLAESVECGAKIFSRQQERSRLRDEISDGPASVGPIRRAHLARIDAAAEPTAVIDDEYLLDAGGRKPSVQLVERQLASNHRAKWRRNSRTNASQRSPQ